ncbi:MAG: SCO family protein [Bacteroidota bacterium]
MKKLISSILVLISLINISSCKKSSEKLPVLNYTITNEGAKDYYEIEYKGFTNQLNQPFTSQILAGKVTITNFFFTRCPSICQPMRQRLISLANEIEDENFIIVSHTIDPGYDSLEVLKEYSESTGISSNKWQFLRASEDDTKKIAQQFMTNFSTNQEGTDFYHSSYATLLDQDQNIRGFYNLLIDAEIERLKTNINLLLE